MTTPSASVVEGCVDPLYITIPCTTDITDLTGADVTSVEVYVPAWTIVVPDVTGWAFAVTAAAGAAGEPMVATVTPPSAGYPIGGFAFTQPPLRPAVGFRVRAFVTLAGGTWAIPCAVAEIAVTARNGRP